MSEKIGWREVRARVLEAINTGVWRPGMRIPDEAELARLYGCARLTVAHALRTLAEEGLLERRRKGGTRVLDPPRRRAVVHIPIIRDDIARRGATPGYRLLSDQRAPLPEPWAKALGVPLETEWRHVRALHLADEVPFCLEDRWLAPARAEGTSFAEISANEWLVRNIPVIEGTVAWSAEALGSAEAALLAAKPGAPVLVLTRTTRDSSGPVTAVRLVYAPGHRLEAQL